MVYIYRITKQPQTMKQETLQKGNLSQEDALAFILGGNATFTIKSNLTDKRFTYKVLRDKNNEKSYKVSMLYGPDNVTNYKMIGWFHTAEGPFMTPWSPPMKTYDAFVALDFVYQNLQLGIYMPNLEIWHEGRCCRCGRALTVPESIANGIGPECAKSVNVSNF